MLSVLDLKTGGNGECGGAVRGVTGRRRAESIGESGGRFENVAKFVTSIPSLSPRLHAVPPASRPSPTPSTTSTPPRASEYGVVGRFKALNL